MNTFIRLNLINAHKARYLSEPCMLFNKPNNKLTNKLKPYAI